MEILSRLELNEPVSLDELIYLYKLAKDFPEVEKSLMKLLSNFENIDSESLPYIECIAA